VVETLAETGSLQGAKGGYQLLRPAAELRLPATVKAVLAARIDRLSEREKQVLQTAAVIGREFTEPVLRRVVELSETDFTASLQKLTNAELVYEEALYPQAQYAFKHALTQEVAYGSQLLERRARIHEAVARALAEIAPEARSEQAAVLAVHWERAGKPLEAARSHLRAGRWLMTRNLGEALRHWQRVRELLAPMPDGESVDLTQARRMPATPLTLVSRISPARRGGDSLRVGKSACRRTWGSALACPSDVGLPATGGESEGTCGNTLSA
jgi:adenylate cyclase